MWKPVRIPESWITFFFFRDRPTDCYFCTVCQKLQSCSEIKHLLQAGLIPSGSPQMWLRKKRQVWALWGPRSTGRLSQGEDNQERWQLLGEWRRQMVWKTSSRHNQQCLKILIWSSSHTLEGVWRHTESIFFSVKPCSPFLLKPRHYICSRHVLKGRFIIISQLHSI